MQCTGFGNLRTIRINTDDAHSSTGSDKKPAAVIFSRTAAENQGTPAGRPLLKCRVIITTKSQEYRGGCS